MSLDEQLSAVNGKIVAQLVGMKANWEQRLEEAKVEEDAWAVQICERMIARYEERIKARGGSSGNGDNHGL